VALPPVKRAIARVQSPIRVNVFFAFAGVYDYT